MIRTILKPFSFLPAILLMIMIYQFSAQPASVSTEVSRKVSYKLVQAADYILDTNLDEWQMEEYAIKINGVTRKLAHMTEYFLLAVAVAFPLYVYGLHGIPLMLLVGLICVGFACTDEFHQAFVSGRSPAKKDVAIDSFGVFWGIILVRMIGFWGRHTIFKPKPKKKLNKKTVSQSVVPNPVLDPVFIPVNQSPQFIPVQSAPVFVPPTSVTPSASVIPPVTGSPVIYPDNPAEQQAPHQPLTVNPEDPFQDWLDDYFPKQESTK